MSSGRRGQSQPESSSEFVARGIAATLCLWRGLGNVLKTGEIILKNKKYLFGEARVLTHAPWPWADPTASEMTAEKGSVGQGEPLGAVRDLSFQSVRS